MYPGFIHWWKSEQGEDDPRVFVGVGGGRWRREARCGGRMRDTEEEGPGSFGASAFGVRRPLRFLAYKLDLDETQVAELARILDELKTERAQAAVDHRRTVTAFADAVAGESFDDSRAGEGAKMRTQSAERVRDAVLKALRQIHKLLQPEQRARLAYLIRTGTLNL